MHAQCKMQGCREGVQSPGTALFVQAGAGRVSTPALRPTEDLQDQQLSMCTAEHLSMRCCQRASDVCLVAALSLGMRGRAPAAYCGRRWLRMWC